jgi:hypothetical protein
MRLCRQVLNSPTPIRRKKLRPGSKNLDWWTLVSCHHRATVFAIISYTKMGKAESSVTMPKMGLVDPTEDEMPG